MNPEDFYPVKHLIEPFNRSFSLEQIQELERELLENLTHKAVIIQKVGRCIASFYEQKFGNKSSVMIFCGAGNNGADGYALAHILKKKGVSVLCYYIEEPKASVAQDAKKRAEASNVQTIKLTNGFTKIALHSNITLVDALFGIGLNRPIIREYRQLIEWINRQDLPVISIDIPSGLKASTGLTFSECCIEATYTLSCIGLKNGLFLRDGKQYCGEIYLSHLGLPVQLLQQEPSSFHVMHYGHFQDLPKRKQDSHKGLFGQVWAIGGNIYLSGALLIALDGVTRVGPGKTYFSTPENHHDLLVSQLPHCMYMPLNTKSVYQREKENAVLLLGPGLGRDKWAKETFFLTMNHMLNSFGVIDADALILLASSSFKNLRSFVLTPHPKEAATLLDSSVDVVQENRVLATKQIAQKYGATVVLKGRGTIICSANSQLVYLCPYGNSGLAVGGTGDLLSGIIAGLMAHGLPPFQAARLGVLIHSVAADNYARENGEYGMLPRVLAEYIAPVLNKKMHPNKSPVISEGTNNSRHSDTRLRL